MRAGRGNGEKGPAHWCPYLTTDRCGFSEAEVQRLKTDCEFFFGQWHGAGTQVENCSTPVWLAPRAGAEPVPLCPVYPPAPSWLQRKSLCCSETNSSDPDCFPSRGLKSVGKQTQLNGVNLSPPKRGTEHWGLWAGLSAMMCSDISHSDLGWTGTERGWAQATWIL